MMRTIGQPRGKESQLQIVHETSQEITLQIGEIPKAAVMKKAKVSMILGLIIMLSLISFVLVFVFINNRAEMLIAQNSFYLFYLLPLVFVISSIVMIALGFYSPLFIFWTFNCSNQEIIKSTTNLLGKTHTYTFPFNEVEGIHVKEHHDSPQALTELYMVLKSGKQLTLSVSSYTHKESEKAINLEYHQLLAEKMRRYAGL